MVSSVLIAGCGYVGTALGRRLVSAGNKVWGIRRDPAMAAALSRENIEPLIGDLTDSSFLNVLPPAEAVVFCAAPSRENDNYRKTYLDAASLLLDRFARGSLKKFIFISSTSVYSAKDGSWVDEKVDPNPDTEDAQTLHAAEQRVLKSGHPAVVFRLAGIYGAGRNRIRPIREGKFKPALSDEWTNRIHVEDIVGGLELLLQKGRAGEVYLGADDSPATQREFYTWLYGKLGMTPPAAGEGRIRHGGSNKRVWNGKIKNLGLQLRYSNYKEGYADLLAADA